MPLLGRKILRQSHLDQIKKKVVIESYQEPKIKALEEIFGNYSIDNYLTLKLQEEENNVLQCVYYNNQAFMPALHRHIKNK